MMLPYQTLPVDLHRPCMAMARALRRYSGFDGKPNTVRAILASEGFDAGEINEIGMTAAAWEAMRRQLFEMKEAA